jgi:radical SAM protein with 4Fe4S-binding SPASM domain
MNKANILKDSVYYYACKKLSIAKIRQINFAVTYKCNSKCVSCDIWKTYISNKNPPKELSTAEIKKIFSQFPQLRLASLTGGEPFLRKDLLQIASAIKSDYLNISTNGLMTDGIVQFAKRMLNERAKKNLGISVSIDAIGGLNDKIRGVPNSFGKSLDTIKALKGLQKKYSSLQIGISSTISKENIDNILDVYKLAKKLGVIFSTRVAQTSALFYNNTCAKIFLEKRDMPKVRKIFRFLIRENPRNLFYKIYLNKFLGNPNKQPVPCFSGTNSYFIDPYGNLYPCIMLNHKIGSLRKDSLRTLLMSGKAKKIREFIRNGRCSCWTDCEAVNSLYSNPFGLAYSLLAGRF